jgi:hypothetical protein
LPKDKLILVQFQWKLDKKFAMHNYFCFTYHEEPDSPVTYEEQSSMPDSWRAQNTPDNPHTALNPPPDPIIPITGTFN